MKKIERLRTKVFVFIIVSGLMSFYAVSKLFSLFQLTKGPLFIGLCVFLSISYLLGAELLRIFNNDFIKGISAVFSTWFGASFIFLWTFGIYDIVNLIFPIDFHKIGFFILGIDIVLIFYSIYNATTFSVRTIRVESDKINRPFKIVQLSDLHIGAAHKSDFLDKTVDRVNNLNPDFVVLTGDLIDGVHPYRGKEFASLNKLNAPLFFTLGNHEKFIDTDEIYTLLKDNKIIFLRNRSVIHDGLQIIGIDDYSNKRDFLMNFKHIVIDDNRFSILLYHRPGVFYEVSKENIDLMLSGHTHGGQIFPLNVLMSIIDGPVSGIHRKNNTILYVSNGTGWWGPPMRLGSRNEITVIELIQIPPQNSIQTNEKNISETTVNESSLEYKLSDLLEEKKNDKDKTTKIKKSQKKAEVVFLKRGKSAIKASEKEDLSINLNSRKQKKAKKREATSKVKKPKNRKNKTSRK